MIRAIESRTSGRAVGGRSLSGSIRALLLLVGALLVVGGSMAMEQRVSRKLAATEGDWQFVTSALPQWFPAGFTGCLADLDRIPNQVPLRSATWRRRIAAALRSNPWIENVSRVERAVDGIAFEAQFLRPAVAVRADGGYLLIDSEGCVIDLQPGPELLPSWGVPEYIPGGREFPRLASGTRLDDPEFEECLSLVRVLWESRTLDRFPGEILALDAYTMTDTPGLLWRMHSRTGVALYWGRAPASTHVSLRPAEEKIRSLQEVLRLGDRIRGAGGITLHGAEPMVVGRL